MQKKENFAKLAGDFLFNIKSYRLSNKSLNYEKGIFFHADLKNPDPIVIVKYILYKKKKIYFILKINNWDKVDNF